MAVTSTDQPEAVTAPTPTTPDTDVTAVPVWALPWSSIRHRMRHAARAAGLVAATGAVGVAAGQPDVPAWPFWAALPVAPLAARLIPSRWFTPGGDADEPGPRRAALVAKRRRAAAYTITAACGWTALAATTGVDVHTWPGLATITLLAPAGAVASRPYVRYWAARPADVTPPAAEPEVEDVDPRAAEFADLVTQRWDTALAAPGKPLAGTRLEDWRPIVGGWAAVVIVGDTASIDPDRVVAAPVRGRVAQAFKVGVAAVTLTADPADASRYHLAVQPRDPLIRVRHWAGQTINPGTGRGETATMADGTRVEHTWWRPGWGSVMCLLAGCTGSGKSEYLNLLLAMERSSGMVVSWVCDPQMGQTLGDVRDGLDWFAPDTAELLTMLRCAKRVLIARNVGLTRMRTEDGRRVKYLDPSPDRPLITITVDEAHIPMSDPDHGKEIVSLLALLAKSGRKANMQVRLLTQSTLLTELKDSVLRSQAASGLVVAFRTAAKLDGAAAWPGRMPVDPADLPPAWPNGDTTAGLGFMSSVRPMRIRADYPGDLYDLAHEGATLGLEPGVLGAAGADYAQRAARLALFDGMDPAVLLGMAEKAMAREDHSADVPATGRDAVLAFLADADEPVPFRRIAEAVANVVKTRQLTNIMRRLVDCGAAVNDDGAYTLTDEGRTLAGRD